LNVFEGAFQGGAKTIRSFSVPADGVPPSAGMGLMEDGHRGMRDSEMIYSGVSDPDFDASGQNFLRGYQVTGADGKATFVTIFPGWYPGRCVHIHFKVHHDTPERGVVFTSQLFFEDTFSDLVFVREPSASRGLRNPLNNADRIYDDQLLLNVSRDGEGYAATLDIDLQAG